MTNLDRSQQAATGTGRRRFLSTSAVGLAVTAAAPTILEAAPTDRVRVAVIGCGGQGKHHVSSVLSLAEHNVELVAVCDVDQSRLAEAKKIAPKAEVVSDLRRVLENPEIDAVSDQHADALARDRRTVTSTRASTLTSRSQSVTTSAKAACCSTQRGNGVRKSVLNQCGKRCRGRRRGGAMNDRRC